MVFLEAEASHHIATGAFAPDPGASWEFLGRSMDWWIWWTGWSFKWGETSLDDGYIYVYVCIPIDDGYIYDHLCILLECWEKKLENIIGCIFMYISPVKSVIVLLWQGCLGRFFGTPGTNFWWENRNGFRFFNPLNYPLVMTNIAMENHHFEGVNPLCLWPCSMANC